MTRIAMLSVHACPLARLGGRDSGGMNVYVRELARELGGRGIDVDVFTRWREREDPQIQALGANARVIHLVSGPIGYYPKMDVYRRLPEFTERVLEFARNEHRRYDLVHSHYWLSAEVADVVRHRWRTPVVQMFHTLGLVKAQAMDDSMNGEGQVRELAERAAVQTADRSRRRSPSCGPWSMRTASARTSISLAASINASSPCITPRPTSAPCPRSWRASGWSR